MESRWKFPFRGETYRASELIISSDLKVALISVIAHLHNACINWNCYNTISDPSKCAVLSVVTFMKGTLQLTFFIDLYLHMNLMSWIRIIFQEETSNYAEEKLEEKFQVGLEEKLSGKVMLHVCLYWLFQAEMEQHLLEYE